MNNVGIACKIEYFGKRGCCLRIFLREDWFKKFVKFDADKNLVNTLWDELKEFLEHLKWAKGKLPCVNDLLNRPRPCILTYGFSPMEKRGKRARLMVVP